MALLDEDQITKLMDLLEIPEEKRNFEEMQDQIQKFENLTQKDLKMFGEINQSSKEILDYQMDKPTLLRKFRILSKEIQKNWIEKIESAKNSGKDKAIISYLKWMLKKGVSHDYLPCYSSSFNQSLFRQTIQDLSSMTIGKLSDEDTELVKMMASLIDNPNQNMYGFTFTPINNAAKNGHTEIVKILAPLMNNPNAPARLNGETPIYVAARNGYTEIVKILANALCKI